MNAHGNTRNISDALELAETEQLLEGLREELDFQSLEWSAAGDWEAIEAREEAAAALEQRAEELRSRLPERRLSRLGGILAEAEAARERRFSRLSPETGAGKLSGIEERRLSRPEELRLRLRQTEERSLRNLSERLSLPLPPLGGMWPPAASEVNREAEQLGAELRSQRAELSEELRLQFLRRSSVSRSELEEGFPL